MKNRDIAGLAVIGLFCGGLMGISFWALLVFEFVMRMEAAGNPKTSRMMRDF
jgi:hypothetical protein